MFKKIWMTLVGWFWDCYECVAEFRTRRKNRVKGHTETNRQKTLNNQKSCPTSLIKGHTFKDVRIMEILDAMDNKYWDAVSDFMVKLTDYLNKSNTTMVKGRTFTGSHHGIEFAIRISRSNQLPNVILTNTLDTEDSGKLLLELMEFLQTNAPDWRIRENITKPLFPS